MEGEGNGGAGGAGGAGDTGGGAPGGAAGGAAGGNAEWFANFGSEEVRGYVKAKGFKDAESLADAYRNLEKTRGVPAERLLTLPTDDKPESWAPIFNRLGRPETADGYEIPEIPGGNPEFSKWMQGTFHELGLTKKQAEGFASKFVENMNAATKAQNDQALAAKNDQIQALKTKWGAAAKENAETVDAFVAASGLTEAQAEAMEKALGFDGFMEVMHGLVKKFGIKLKESPFHEGGMGAGNNFGGAMTPSEAKARIDLLKSDEEWRGKFAKGDAKAVMEMNRLYAFAYPSPT